MDKEDEIWFIHDHDLYADDLEDYERYLELLMQLESYGNLEQAYEEVKEWLEMLPNTEQKSDDYTEKV